jgi:hypothetical protein
VRVYNEAGPKGVVLFLAAILHLAQPRIRKNQNSQVHREIQAARLKREVKSRGLIHDELREHVEWANWSASRWLVDRFSLLVAEVINVVEPHLHLNVTFVGEILAKFGDRPTFSRCSSAKHCLCSWLPWVTSAVRIGSQ